MPLLTFNQVLYLLDEYSPDEIVDNKAILAEHGWKYFVQYMAMERRKSSMETEVWVQHVRNDPYATPLDRVIASRAEGESL